MKKIFLLFVALLFVVACNLPFFPFGSSPTETPNYIVVTATSVWLGEATASSPMPEWTAATPGGGQTLPKMILPTELPGTTIEGVTMSFPPCLSNAVMGGTYPAPPYDPMGGPMEVYPEHRRFDFTSYPLSDTFFPAFVRVFPVAGFAEAYALADNNYAQEQVVKLYDLLTVRPLEVDNALPFLVMTGAAQLFHTKLTYLSFANGNGIRYLTQYGQYYAPYNNYDLFYTFQGITSDAKYWVSVVFPVNHSLLPASADATEVPPGSIPIPSVESSTYEDDMMEYYARMDGLMYAAPDNTFTPALDCLDQFVQSLVIGD